MVPFQHYLLYFHCGRMQLILLNQPRIHLYLLSQPLQHQLKLLHKHIIDVADELYRFSDELDMSDNEEHICKISIIESIKELNNVAKYLTKRALGDTNEAPK